MGWQIEKEYDQMQQKKAKDRAARIAAGGDADDVEADNPFLVREADDDGLPFACHICREDFRSPVQTQCNHYFCEECAVRHYATSQLCAVCGKQTNGLFNPNPIKLLAKLRAAALAKDGTPPSSAPKKPAAAASGWEVVVSDEEKLEHGPTAVAPDLKTTESAPDDPVSRS
jgi:hypothetical protein